MQLRSASEPMGLSTLKERAPRFSLSVDLENEGLEAKVDIARGLGRMRQEWLMMVPATSYAWLCSCITELTPIDVHFADCASCMYGAPRERVIRFAGSSAMLVAKLGVGCDGTHQHAAWGGQLKADLKADALELPDRLANALVANFARLARASGARVVPVRTPLQSTQPRLPWKSRARAFSRVVLSARRFSPSTLASTSSTSTRPLSLP